jgi:siroheme decarboxylase
VDDLTPRDKELIRLLQKDLPLVPEPFAEIGKHMEMTGEEVLAKIEEWRQAGIIRRFGAAVRHLKLGYNFNILTVWNPPAGEMDTIAYALAARPEVSHLYQRTALPDIPHNLFAMVHGRTQDEAMNAIEAVAKETNCTDYLLFQSMHEYKRDSMRYFLEED